MKAKKLPPIHPGEILLEEFLEPMGISQYRLAKSLSVPARRINEIVHGKRAITADTAIRLARYFGTSPQLWMNLQAASDPIPTPGSHIPFCLFHWSLLRICPRDPAPSSPSH